MLPYMYANTGIATAPKTGSATLSFTILLTGPAPGPVSVDYATSDDPQPGLGSAGTDYTATSGTLKIPAGQSSGTISVTILADPAAAGFKEFFLTLSNPVGVGKIATPKLSGLIMKAGS